MKRVSAKLKARAEAINDTLAEAWPDAGCALVFHTPFELLVATILSAQCTDKRVNLVTPALFEKYPTAEKLAQADQDDVEELIKTTGFFHNKARNIIGMARSLVADFHGNVPRTMEELISLPGVGRKTANVVLGNCFDTPGLTVDTHMQRVNRRLGLTRETDPVRIERDLMKLIPQPQWTLYSHRIILHGRAVCVARKPRCGECVISALCDYFLPLGKKRKP